MTQANLVLVLGDQLSPENPALKAADPQRDVVLMAEVGEEAGYVPHNRHKIAFIFAAMRHLAQRLEKRGFRVIYRSYDEGVVSLQQAVEEALSEGSFQRLRVCEPGEYRLRQQMAGWQQLFGLPVELLEDSRFLCSTGAFAAWADEQKSLRMEYFYRNMRKRYGLLLDVSGKPEGGRWNYDQENRKGWRAQEDVPSRPAARPDRLTRGVIELVENAFPDNPGDLSQFYLEVTPEGARKRFDWFLEHGLERFGTYQDGLAEESPWLFHALISMYINVGLLEPLEVCQRVEQAYREGRCELAAAEGFIRQVLGWREYIRGVYWYWMPEYKARNHFEATRALPSFFWDAKTDMRCLSRALEQSLELGYAHHIQRLMVIGNFALLAGLDVEAVCDWYLAVYVDAFEWVELPNTLGMALHADGGMMASKPYAASGKYIQRQGNHCAQCRYSPNVMTGKKTCPYNALYWRFIDSHEQALKNNGRMGLVLKNWQKKPPAERRAILDWADKLLEVHCE